MTRRAGLLTAATAATLLLAAWVSAAGAVGIFARSDLTFTSKLPGEEYSSTAESRGGREVERSSGASDPGDFLVQVIDWVMKVIVVVVVLAVLVAVARMLVDRWQSRDRADSSDEEAANLVPQVLLRQARESEELLAQGTPGNAVIAAWVGLEEAVRSAGVRLNHSLTSEELVTTVLRSYAVDRASLDELSALYREARFSRHEVTESMRERARAALQQVQADLSRQVRATRTAPRAGAGR